jgi:hypothetical protein
MAGKKKEQAEEIKKQTRSRTPAKKEEVPAPAKLTRRASSTS